MAQEHRDSPIKPHEVIMGGYYRIEDMSGRFIIVKVNQFETHNSTGRILSGNISRFIGPTISDMDFGIEYRKDCTPSFYDRYIKKASALDVQWLKRCIKANELVDRPKVIREHYEIY